MIIAHKNKLELSTLSPPFWWALRAFLWESSRDTTRIFESRDLLANSCNKSTRTGIQSHYLCVIKVELTSFAAPWVGVTLCTSSISFPEKALGTTLAPRLRRLTLLHYSKSDRKGDWILTEWWNVYLTSDNLKIRPTDHSDLWVSVRERASWSKPEFCTYPVNGDCSSLLFR